MELIVPYIDELRGLDARMVRLAEFLGISCETIALARNADPVEFLNKHVPEQCTCFLVNPQLIKEWVALDHIPAKLVNFLLSRFTHLVVHGLHVDPFDSQLVAALSQGRLKSVEAIDDENAVYAIAKDSKDICETFSGFSFGPVNPLNDHVLPVHGDDPAVRQLIAIGCHPFMASVRTEGASVLFVASEDLADLNEDAGDTPIAKIFSRFVPQVMALRHVADDACWRPAHLPHATVIIDDPPLWKRYGFLNFKRVLALTDEFNFHICIAYIPYYWQSTSASTVRLFHQRPDRWSLCFHGNDHTSSEFATHNFQVLNWLVEAAKVRMRSLSQLTGLPYGKIIVFPQGRFSRNAMQVLKERGFIGAVNSGYSPRGEKTSLTVAELMRPSILSFNGFPLFLRKYPKDIRIEDIAFNAFFGRPLLIVEHHDIFKDPSSLLSAVSMINEAIPQVKWCNLQTTLENAYLVRQSEDGTLRVHPFATVGQIVNSGSSIIRCVAEWDSTTLSTNSEISISLDGSPSRNVSSSDAAAELSFDVAPRETRRIALHFSSDRSTQPMTKPTFTQRVRTHLRRRLSELRDNYLSKSPAAMAFVNLVSHMLFE